MYPSALVPESDDTCIFHPTIFNSLDGALIRDIASQVKGSADPSGLDSNDWTQMFCSFKDASHHLCNTLADTAKRIASSYIDPSGLDALNACRLIPLDKMPGVRPIGVGEVAKRILGKAILKIVKEDIQRVVGPLQMCAGYENGVEVASLAMQAVFGQDSTEAVLLVDAENAFNSERAHEIFGDSDLIITLEGRMHLGIPLGTSDYRNQCIQDKVQEWSRQVKKLGLFAKSQPHAAFAAFVHGIISGWTFFEDGSFIQ